MIHPADLKLAAASILSPQWRRGPATIDGDAVRLDARRAEDYDIVDALDVLFDLAALFRAPTRTHPRDDVDLELVREFVARHGLLYNGVNGSASESLAKWREAASATYAALVDVDDFRQALQSVSGYTALRRRWSGASVLPRRPEFLSLVAQVLAFHVNEGLRGTEQRVRASGEEFEQIAEPKSLVGLAFSQLALVMLRRIPLRTCEECGRYFEVDDGRRRFHSEQCQNRNRSRRWREEQDVKARKR